MTGIFCTHVTRWRSLPTSYIAHIGLLTMHVNTTFMHKHSPPYQPSRLIFPSYRKDTHRASHCAGSPRIVCSTNMYSASPRRRRSTPLNTSHTIAVSIYTLKILGKDEHIEHAHNTPINDYWLWLMIAFDFCTVAKLYSIPTDLPPWWQLLYATAKRSNACAQRTQHVITIIIINAKQKYSFDFTAWNRKHALNHSSRAKHANCRFGNCVYITPLALQRPNINRPGIPRRGWGGNIYKLRINYKSFCCPPPKLRHAYTAICV